ncbi:hypothetical protein [Pseudalkalibacillus salsuginis]|uniref:hypothetical protein n=1 Tax=Pseudalkalibacillus salsuginis TaxID=2910972 RepID=UPI001F423F2C|nr:hypothetical protein [Pseudalkalibacillus salsuginis]MCF6410594.1 hypothetical protein [Pseudalkalibacillus salsuginis]
MSLKLIELQVAIPRTLDTGKMQEKFQQQSQINQSQAASTEKEKAERNRTSVEKQEHIEKQHFNGRQDSHPHHQQQKRDKNNQE